MSEPIDYEHGERVLAKCSDEVLEVEARKAKERGEVTLAAEKYLDAVFVSQGWYKQCRFHCICEYKDIMASQMSLFAQATSARPFRKVDGPCREQARRSNHSCICL